MGTGCQEDEEYEEEEEEKEEEEEEEEDDEHHKRQRAAAAPEEQFFFGFNPVQEHRRKTLQKCNLAGNLLHCSCRGPEPRGP